MAGLIDTLQFKVMNIIWDENNEARIYYRAVDPAGEMNLSGYIPGVTEEEFFANASLKLQSEFVKRKVVERLTGTNPAAGGTPTA